MQERSWVCRAMVVFWVANVTLECTGWRGTVAGGGYAVDGGGRRGECNGWKGSKDVWKVVEG